MIVCELVFVALFVLSKRLRAWNHGFERSINDYQLLSTILARLSYLIKTITLICGHIFSYLRCMEVKSSQSVVT